MSQKSSVLQVMHSVQLVLNPDRRSQTILLERERIKHQTFKTRRLLHRKNAA